MQAYPYSEHVCAIRKLHHEWRTGTVTNFLDAFYTTVRPKGYELVKHLETTLKGRLQRTKLENDLFNIYDHALKFFEELETVAENIVKRNEERDAKKVRATLKGLVNIDHIKTVLDGDDKYKNEFLDSACGIIPKGLGGSRKLDRKGKNTKKVTPQSTGTKIMCKDGKKRIVYVRGETQYVKKKHADGKMRFVRV